MNKSHIISYFQLREDAENLARAQNNNVESKVSLSSKEDKGMYNSLSLHHLYTLLDCLIQAHRFARNFNADSEQRTVLWKSGFIGNAKPNLLKQETQSLSCCLRIMFRLYFDKSRSDCWTEVENRLLPLCSEVGSTDDNMYYHSIYRLSPTSCL